MFGAKNQKVGETQIVWKGAKKKEYLTGIIKNDQVLRVS